LPVIRLWNYARGEANRWRVSRLQIIGAHVKEKLRNMQIDCQNYAYEFGVDKPEIDQWTCP
jgi:xylulose-5-phosphate/fructose-6-phosphate phosphoketolase